MSLFFLTLPFSHATSLIEINKAISQYNSHGAYSLKPMTQADVDALRLGKILHHMESKEGEPMTTLGCILTEATLEDLWLASQDTHFQLEGRLRSTLIEDRGNGDMLWYSHIDAPWPFNDRHWVNDTQNNRALSRATNNNVWETHWRLDPNTESLARPFIERGDIDNFTMDEFDASLVVEASIGGWIGIRLESKSLFFLYTAFSPGGIIPDELVAKTFYDGMPKMMIEIQERALHTVKTHYTKDHAPMYGGDSRIIRPYPRVK